MSLACAWHLKNVTASSQLFNRDTTASITVEPCTTRTFHCTVSSLKITLKNAVRVRKHFTKLRQRLRPMQLDLQTLLSLLLQLRIKLHLNTHSTREPNYTLCRAPKIHNGVMANSTTSVFSLKWTHTFLHASPKHIFFTVFWHVKQWGLFSALIFCISIGERYCAFWERSNTYVILTSTCRLFSS